MAYLGDLLVRLGVDTADFQSDLGKATRIMRRSMNDVQNAVLSVKGALGALAGGASLAGLAAVTKYALETGDQMYKMSQKVGISVEALSGLKYAAELSDLPLEGLQMGIKKLSTAMVEAQAGGKEQANLFRVLGTSATDASGKLRQPGDMLIALADKFAGMKDGTEKAALAVKLFGKTGLDLIPFMNLGSEAIRKMVEEAQRFGVVWSTDAAKGAEEFNDNLKRMKALNEGLVVSFTSSLLPLATTIQEAFIHSKDEAGSFHNELKKILDDRQKLEGWAQSIAVAFAHVADAVKASWGVLQTLVEGVVLLAGRGLQLAAKVQTMTPAGWALDKATGGSITAAGEFGRSMADTAQANIEARLKAAEGPTFAQRTEAMFEKARKNSDLRAIYGAGGYAAGGKPKGAPDLSGLKGGMTKEQEEKLYRNALQQLELELGKVNAMSKEQEVQYKLTEGSLRGLTAAHKEDLLATARLVDARKNMLMVDEELFKSSSAMNEQRLRTQQTVTDVYNANRLNVEQAEYELATVGMTTREMELLNLQRQIAVEKEQRLAQIAQEAGDNLALYDERRAELEAEFEAFQQRATDLIVMRQQKERDWATGASQAFKEYLDEATNAAKMTHDLFTDALRGLEDAFVEFAKTGKLSFKSLADSMIADMARIAFRAAITPILQGASGWLTGTFGKLIGSFFGGARAEGGPVSSGRAYLVGEGGPELFVPGSSGSIVPNGGGSVTIVQNIKVDSRSDMASIMAAMRSAKEAAVAQINEQFMRGVRP